MDMLLSSVNLGFLRYHETKLPDSLLSSIIALVAPYAPLDGVNDENEISGKQWSIKYDLSEQGADIVVGMKYDSIFL